MAGVGRDADSNSCSLFCLGATKSHFMQLKAGLSTFVGNDGGRNLF